MENSAKVVIDYGKTLAKMLKIANFDFVDPNINDKAFSIKRSGRQEVELFTIQYNRLVTTNEVIKHLKQLGLELAKIEHLIAFKSVSPESKPQFIVALGSDLDGNYPLYSHQFEDYRLDMSWPSPNPHWGSHWRFLAFREAA